ncbi:hypothetical protein [Anabaena sp. UHCC 0399]|nr:hypothetical protein [Anabaena sp. UHCC 0399]MEA5564916.1 hypothetical protein [Anabaena sp. UHCC 0399]
MNKPDEELELHLKPRETETVSIKIPKETLESLKKVAANRDMSIEGLLKFYIGKSLRQDLSKLFSERVLESTAQFLTRHIHSEDEIKLKEILKKAIVEVIQEQKEVMSDLMAEIMEDIALATAIKEGENTEIVSREVIFKTLSS